MIATCHKSTKKSDSFGRGGPTWEIIPNFFVTFHSTSHTYDTNTKEVASP
jgi:hypothetical protein